MTATHLWHTFTFAILTASAFSVGVAAYLAAVNSLAWVRGDSQAWTFAFARIGYALVVGAVVHAIVTNGREVPLDIRSLAYFVGLILGTVGLIGIAVNHHSRRRRKGDARAT